MLRLDEDVRDVMSHFDKDGSGDLNLEEFKALAQVGVLLTIIYRHHSSPRLDRIVCC